MVTVDRKPPTFSLQNQLEKVKIDVTLTELLKQPNYKVQVSQFMCPPTMVPLQDNLKPQEEIPMVIFGPHVEEQDPSTPLFYVTFQIHQLLLHKCMLDSGASHNLMSLFVMEQLGLQITIPYKYLYSFDSKRVKCLGLTKYMVVSLAQIPVKSVVMVIVVVDIPVMFGILFSRSRGQKVGGSIKMDSTYATIPSFDGEEH